VGRSIAAVIGASQKRGGYFEGGGYIVSWCAGHLLELAAPDAYGEQYAKWCQADLPIIPEIWKHTAAKDKAAQLKILKELMIRADVECVINACDAGREGELIFRLVYEYAKSKKPIKRLWISSMEDAAIRAGFENIAEGAAYDNLYAAASCRERADWLVGINATRLFSTIYGATLNTGRVQSPTLAMLVRREAEIAAFVKEPFYTPVIDLGGFTANGERLKDKQSAEAVRAACDGVCAVVHTVERQKKTAAPPKLFDLTSLQRDANRLLGFTAQQTLDYAQSLYEKAVLSYPRTDSRYLTADMRGTAGTIVAAFLSDTRFSGGAAFAPNLDRLIDDKRVADHHAIIPTSEAVKTNMAALPAGERDILSLVIVRLLCAAAPVHSYEAVTATLDCGSFIFRAMGKTVLVEGWKAVDNAFKALLKQKPGADEPPADGEDAAALPELANGQVFSPIAASVKEGVTTPPKHFTEDTLLSYMETAGAEDMPDDVERKGLGTPATRAAIIEKLVKAGFMERQKKNLIPTDKGKNLIAVLPEALTSPMLTAEWENKLLDVQRGKLPCDEFMRGIADFTRAIVTENNAPKAEFASLFGGGRQTEGEPLGVCPRCGAAVREGAKGFFCDTRTCGFKLWKASKFWEAKKKPLSAAIVAALLKEGRAAISGLHSEKTGKKYDAVVVLDDTGGEYVNFKLDFGNGGKRYGK
jgi:DNA topoisomerase-3